MRFRGLRRFTWRWWLALPFSLGDLWRRLTPKDRMAARMSFWWYGDLPRQPVHEVFPGTEDADFSILHANRRDPTTSTTLWELNCILLGLRASGARRVVEVGTFDGNTTLNLASNLPDGGEVVTIDLPPEAEAPDYSLEVDGAFENMTDRHKVGEQFADHPVSPSIRQVFGDSAALDWSSLGGPFDMAFIDGCHAYEYVISDTEHALEVVRPGGLIMWHDYAEMESVSRAVDTFADRLERTCAIQGTRIAVGFVRDE